MTIQGHVVLKLPERAVHHVPHTVNEAHFHGRAAVEFNLDGLLRHKLRFRCHDGAAGTGLRQFVAGALAHVNVFDLRKDHGVHKPFDKGRFPVLTGPTTPI